MFTSIESSFIVLTMFSISGASGSLGRGAAVALAKEGWQVALTGRDDGRLQVIICN